VIKPLQSKFPSQGGQQGFKDGRLHSFRHYFASTCATSGIPERVAMDWLGHQDSEMVRHYFHLHDDESKRQMDRLNLINGAASSAPNQTGNPSTGISSDGTKNVSRSQRATNKTKREKASQLS
jgi:hypothetical protein